MKEGFAGSIPREGLVSSDVSTAPYTGPEFVDYVSRRVAQIAVIVAESATEKFSPGSRVRFYERGVRAQIIRWVGDDQPRVVECRLVDRLGQAWSFIDKLPVVSLHDLNRGSGPARPTPSPLNTSSTDAENGLRR